MDKDDVSARARNFVRMIEKFRKTVSLSYGLSSLSDLPSSTGIQLPDLDFAINARSEGRVLVPWEYQKYSNLTRQESLGMFLSFSPSEPFQANGLKEAFQTAFPSPIGGGRAVSGKLIVGCVPRTLQPDGSWARSQRFALTAL
jgi:hypothetical protein